MNTRKRTTIDIEVNGRRSSASIDQITAALVPKTAKLQPYTREAVGALWSHLRPTEDLPDDPIVALSIAYGCGYSAVVSTALSFYKKP